MRRTELSSLVDLIYEAALGNDLAWRDFLEALRDAVGGCQAALFIQGLGDVPSRMLSLGDPALDRAYGEHYGAVNPWFTRGAHLIRPGAVVTSEWFSPGDLRRTEFYADWLRPQDMFHALNGFIFEGSGMAGNVAVARPWSGDGFGTDSLRLIQLLMPHLQRALEIQRRLGAPPAGAQGAGWIDELPCALLFVDDQIRATTINQAGARLIERRVGLELGARGEVRLVRRDENQRFRTLVGGATRWGGTDREAAGGLVTVTPPDGGRPIALVVSPVRSRLLAFPGQMAAPALVMVADPASPAGPRREDLERLYGLTRREADLAVRLARGLKLADAATDMGIGREAAHTHLAHVMQKTDTHRQAELLRLLLLGCPRSHPNG